MNQTAPEGYSVAPWIVTDDTGALLDFITAATALSLRECQLRTAPSATARSESATPSYLGARTGRRCPRCYGSTCPTRTPPSPPLSRMARESSTEAADSAWGDAAAGSATFGNIWWVVSRTEQVSPDQSWQRMSEPRFADAMRDAQQTLDAELSGRRTGVASTPQRPTH